MNNRRLFWLLIMMLAGAMLLTACGGGDETAEEPAAQPTEVPTQAPAVASTEAPAPEPTEELVTEPEIFLTVWADDTRTPILQALAADFEAAYGVGLVVEQIADINNDFPIAAPAGEGPDIFIGPHDRLGGWVASGLLAPIELGAKAADFTEVSLSAFTLDGQLYGMPYAVENMALFRNLDLAPEAPATWDEMIEMGTALQDSGAVSYGLAVEGNGYKVYPILTSFGGYVFGRDVAGNWDPNDLGIDSSGMVAAGEWMATQVASGFMSKNTDGPTAETMFESGEVPFHLNGPWILERFRDAGVNYGISPFPSEGQPFAGVQGFMINALSENVLLAHAFLTEFVATEAIMTELYLTGGRPSAYIPTLEATDDPDITAFSDAGIDAALMPAIPEMGAVWGSWNSAIALVITGEDDPANAFGTAALQIEEALGGAMAGMVNVPGSYQAAAGCEADWDPACDVTALTMGDDGLYTGSHDLPAGDYEGKVALDGSWTVNYGVDGVADGPNYPFSLASDGTVTFTYDPETHVMTIETE